MKIMKYGIILSIVMLCSCGKSGAGEQSISISGAFALYPLAVKWSEEYKKINPACEIEISAGGAGKGMTDVLSGMVDIGMVSREISRTETDKGAWYLSVAIDAVVPVMNSANPLLRKIQTKGLNAEQFSKIWSKKSSKSWSNISSDFASDTLINVYTRSDACGAAQTWGEFIKSTQEEFDGIGVYGDPGVAEAVRKDVYGVGYNNINFVYDRTTRKPVNGISIIPLDINGNGRIDKSEDFYLTREDLTRAIAKGDFPSPPARKLYFVMKGGPEKKALKDFLTYVFTEGQAHVNDAGYILLTGKEVQSNLERIVK
jgi:phosphate transport system substrate-binding protein